MTTLAAFTELMNQFLGELAEVFPDEVAIQEAKKSPPTKDSFMKSVSQWSNQLMNKDSAFFCSDNEFVKNLNLHVVWTTDACTPNTKEAIWQYLQSMYMIGTTMSMFSPELLSVIESSAEKCAKSIQEGNGDMMSMLTQMLGTVQQRAQVKPKSRKKKTK